MTGTIVIDIKWSEQNQLYSALAVGVLPGWWCGYGETPLAALRDLVKNMEEIANEIAKSRERDRP